MGPSTAEQAWKGLAGFSLHPSWKRVLAEEVHSGVVSFEEGLIIT